MVVDDKILDRVKNNELLILKEFDDFCRKNELKYSLIYGTLIGAIRHNGFIPWDDDIDIAMPRKDFEFLCENFPKDNIFFLQNNKTENNYFYTFSKIRLKGTVFKEERLSKMKINHGIFIDVFPFDYVPADNKKAEKFDKMFRFYKTIIDTRVVKISTRHGINKIIAFIFRILFFWISTQKAYNKLNKILKIVNTLEPKGIKNYYCMKQNEKKVFPMDFFDGLIEHDFEKNSFKIIKGYDDFLRKIYGNYLELPPLQERIYAHPVVEIKTID